MYLVTESKLDARTMQPIRILSPITQKDCLLHVIQHRIIGHYKFMETSEHKEMSQIFSYFPKCLLLLVPFGASGYCTYQHFYRFQILRSAHTAVFMRFVWISEQTAIISLYSIN